MIKIINYYYYTYGYNLRFQFKIREKREIIITIYKGKNIAENLPFSLI